MDWLEVASACVLAALIGFGLVLWERHESRRLARGWRGRRLPRPHRPAAGINRRAA